MDSHNFGQKYTECEKDLRANSKAKSVIHFAADFVKIVRENCDEMVSSL